MHFGSKCQAKGYSGILGCVFVTVCLWVCVACLSLCACVVVFGGCLCVCTRMCVENSIPVTVCCCYTYCTSDWTFGAAAYPSKKLEMSVRRHTKVLAHGEG